MMTGRVPQSLAGGAVVVVGSPVGVGLGSAWGSGRRGPRGSPSAVGVLSAAMSSNSALAYEDGGGGDDETHVAAAALRRGTGAKRHSSASLVVAWAVHAVECQESARLKP